MLVNTNYWHHRPNTSLRNMIFRPSVLHVSSAGISRYNYRYRLIHKTPIFGWSTQTIWSNLPHGERVKLSLKVLWNISITKTGESWAPPDCIWNSKCGKFSIWQNAPLAVQSRHFSKLGSDPNHFPAQYLIRRCTWKRFFSKYCKKGSSILQIAFKCWSFDQIYPGYSCNGI